MTEQFYFSLVIYWFLKGNVNFLRLGTMLTHHLVCRLLFKESNLCIHLMYILGNEVVVYFIHLEGRESFSCPRAWGIKGLDLEREA